MIKTIMIIIVGVIVGGGGYILLSKNADDTSTSKSTPAQNSSTDSAAGAASDDTNQQAAATITYSDDGFSPASVTVKNGDTVVIKNDSSRDLEFESDPHPAHTNNEELNVGVVEPGKSMSFKVKQTGNFGYHNHLNASDTGTIIVQ